MSNENPTPPRYVSAEEIAAALNVSPATVRRWTRERRISCLKAGKSAARYDLEEVKRELRQEKTA